MASRTSNQCSCTEPILRWGALAWGLMLCGHHLEILNKFTSESLFYKCSLVEQWSMLWGAWEPSPHVILPLP